MKASHSILTVAGIAGLLFLISKTAKKEPTPGDSPAPKLPEKLIHGVHLPSRTDRVQVICRIANAVVGLGADDNPPGRRKAYLDFIAAGSSPAARDAMAQMSGCGLVARAILRCYGLGDPELRAPYQFGSALSSIVTVARRHGVWHGADSCPQAGDVVLIGVDPTTPAFGGPGHALTTLACDQARITSVDGGQLIHGAQAILMVTRDMQRRESQIWIGNRRIYGLMRAPDIIVAVS